MNINLVVMYHTITSIINRLFYPYVAIIILETFYILT